MTIHLKAAIVAGALGIGFAPAHHADAQTYPTQTIKIIVPTSAGGPVDIVGRMVADILSKRGWLAVVENRPGAGGLLGAREVARAPPDGYTLLVGNTGTLAVNPAVSANPGYDPVKSFAPVAKVWESYQLLTVHESSPWRSLKELIEYAKSNPGRLNYAHLGTGSQPHLSGEYFKMRSDTNIVGVSFRGGVEASTAVLSQAVQMTFADVSILLPLVRDGKLRALAISSAKRSPLALELPTMMEAGVPDYEVTSFFGIVAPAGTPDQIVRTLNAAINEGLKTPETQAKIARFGAVSNPGSPEDFASLIFAHGKHWAEIAKSTGVRTN
jgi:tripartite-type tricarboxylate transporter receptor subunit TctC